ncbi:hypothetical protein [Methanoculleus sp.]|uniref:hypothetical protein n=1 Tax=Methanoculleus sp. TaxID=90427 RepID=UPI0025D111F9|nr:hypothetical protein [Methanoculleus sp.]
MPEMFLQARFGAGYRPLLDRVAPGTFGQAVVDPGTSFELEVPALLEWRSGEAEAGRAGSRGSGLLAGNGWIDKGAARDAPRTPAIVNTPVLTQVRHASMASRGRSSPG